MENTDEEDKKEYLAALGAVSEAPKGMTLAAINRAEKMRAKLRHNRSGRVAKKYTPEVLKWMVSKEINWQIGRTRQMRDAQLEVNDEMRSKGTPFVERMKVVNQRKILWCDLEEERLTKLLKTFRVRPLAEWFDEVDYETAKEMGMGWIIRYKLDEIAYGN